MSSIWALLAAFEEPLPLPEGLESSRLDGAFIEGVNAVSWMANNSYKLKKDGPHCWTFFSTAAFGKRNKVPQVRQHFGIHQFMKLQCTLWFVSHDFIHQSLLDLLITCIMDFEANL